MPSPHSGAGAGRIAALLQAMHAASTREESAHALLCELLDAGQDAASSSRYEGVRFERAVLHLRPDGGYQGVLVLEPGAGRVEIPERDPSFLSSATAWRHVQAHGAPVAIDVLMGTVTIDPGGSTEARPDPNGERFDGKQTLAVMRKRMTTHLLVVPLVDVGGSLVGQVSLEAHCTRAAGQPFIWPDCVATLGSLCRLAVPYLLRLPARRPEETIVDPMLPVVGKTMRSIVRNLRVFARHDETILLLGATGTGKSRLARWCHAHSHRAQGPFEVVDLNAIPTELQQGELFGWRKGAFTGAGRDQEGAVARARGGTLFIDEIDKLDLRAQASLLRLLEDGCYRALGGDKDETGELRFVVGTNADLDEAIGQGRFLPDLYYRINVLPVRLPTLAERLDELPGWSRFMVERRAGDGQAVALAPDSLEPLLEHRWPGNLRQLDNVLRRAFALALVDLQDQAADGGSVTIEREHTTAALVMEQARGGAGAVAQDSPPLAVMERAAAWVAEQAARLHQDGGALPIDTVTSAFRGLVMQAALERGSLEAAFESLGRGNLVKSRNHQKSLRTAKEQIEALRAIVSDA